MNLFRRKIACVIIGVMTLCSHFVYAESLPFVGKREFNFEGGSGTGQTITISKNGNTVIRLHGSMAAGSQVGIVYKGKYKNPLRVYDDTMYKIEKIHGKWVISQLDGKGNIQTGCPFTIYSEALSDEERVHVDVLELPCTVSLNKY